MSDLRPEERLIVAADSELASPCSRRMLFNNVVGLANKLKKTGVCIKVGPALRACGYDLFDEIRRFGLDVFADLKLYDVGSTLSIDGMLLREADPAFLTVSCAVKQSSIRKLKDELPSWTKIIGVTVLTDFDDNDSIDRYVCATEEAVLRLVKVGAKAGLHRFTSSPKEAALLKSMFGKDLSVFTPNVRPDGVIVGGDDQNLERSMAPAEAIKAGADYVIVGRPITQSKDPYGATMRIIEEIARTT